MKRRGSVRSWRCITKRDGFLLRKKPILRFAVDQKALAGGLGY
jgi:hypothetical protein